MRLIPLSPVRKAVILGACAIASLAVLTLSAREFLAWFNVEKQSAEGYQRALKFAPGNAEYHYILGQIYLHEDPLLARSYIERALARNERFAEAWLALAEANGRLGRSAERKEAVLLALKYAPRNINVQWEAANLFFAQGETQTGFKLMRDVIAGDPSRREAGTLVMYKLANGNIDAVMDGIPATATERLKLMEWLLSRNDSVAADQVWSWVCNTPEKLVWGDVRFYVESLINRRELARARDVWTLIARKDPDVSGRIATGNLLVNGDFESNSLNAGFDWRYSTPADLGYVIDTSTFRSGTRSLAVHYDSGPIADSGVFQLVPVEPASRYVLRGFWHAEELQSANGVRLAAVDEDSHTVLGTSDEALGSFAWRETSVEFTTGPEARLARIGFMRLPSNGRIRGTLWLDDLKLEKQ